MITQLESSPASDNIKIVLSQPVPGASNNRAVPMDVDNHQGLCLKHVISFLSFRCFLNSYQEK